MSNIKFEIISETELDNGMVELEVNISDEVYEIISLFALEYKIDFDKAFEKILQNYIGEKDERLI